MHIEPEIDRRGYFPGIVLLGQDRALLSAGGIETIGKRPIVVRGSLE